jgi:hypothetical protein
VSQPSQNLPAARADQRACARQRIRRHVNRDREDRLQQHRARLRERFGERKLGGRAERHVGRVDRMVRAIQQRDRDVDDGKAERPARQRIARAHLHG